MKSNGNLRRAICRRQRRDSAARPSVRFRRSITATRRIGVFALAATVLFAAESALSWQNTQNAQNSQPTRLQPQTEVAPSSNREIFANEADAATVDASDFTNISNTNISNTNISADDISVDDISADENADSNGGAASSFLELVKKSELGGALVYAAQFSNAGDSGVDGGGKFDFDWTLPIDATNALFLEVQANVGYGLDGRVPTFAGLNSCTSYDGSREFYLNELWYEKDWTGGEGRFRTTIGYVDLTNNFDTNAYANDEVTQFMAANFVNCITFDCPGNGLGAYAWWTPNEQYDLGIGYCETSDDGLDMFANGLLIAEIGRNVDFYGRKGTYRFNVWSNFTEYDELDGDGTSTNFGWGVSLDQELTEKFGVFSRFGTQDGDCCSNERSLTVGFETRNFNPARPDDRIGFGYGRTFLSDAHRSAAEHGLATGEDDESNIELYYSFALRNNFAITPSIQWVDAPAGNGDADAIWAPGLRANFEY